MRIYEEPIADRCEKTVTLVQILADQCTYFISDT